MVNLDLLATYALLSYIRESIEEDKRQSLAYVFVPLVKEALASVLRKNGQSEMKGKDYTEIKDQIQELFKIEIPIPVLDTILKIISEEADSPFQLYKDHSYIIKRSSICSIMGDYDDQKKRIEKLERNYKAYCKGQKVNPDFDGLITFIQNQKSRLFDSDYALTLEEQNYHISKYVSILIQKKNEHFYTICDLYLGGIISSYLSFQVRNRIVDTELVIDTNFYISLVDLNTEDSYATCKQLYDLTVAMGYRYKILETTIEQIRILLSNKVSDYGIKDIFSAIDNADILAACERRKLSHSDLQAYKDSLLEDLSRKGITTIYKNNIRELVDKVSKSKSLKPLTNIRGNYDSAFNDLLAIEYVDYKRSGKAVTEFNDVNCWFLTNSYSTNKSEINLPICKRHSINASDLLVLLWYANPSLNIGKEKTMLAVTSLSANVLRFRSEKLPTDKVVRELTKKIANLQQGGFITENSLAKLCIRMSEGCVDDTEAERLMMMTTDQFLSYVNNIEDKEAAFAEQYEKNLELQEQLESEKQNSIDEKIRGEIKTRQAWFVVYAIVIVLLYLLAILWINKMADNAGKYVIHFIYWLVCTVGINYVSHSYFLDGLVSFFRYDSIYNKLLKRLSCK